MKAHCSGRKFSGWVRTSLVALITAFIGGVLVSAAASDGLVVRTVKPGDTSVIIDFNGEQNLTVGQGSAVIFDGKEYLAKTGLKRVDVGVGNLDRSEEHT